MDPFYAFLIFAALLVLDNLAAQAGLAPYFRFGLPLHYRRQSAVPVPDTAAAAQALSEQFRAAPAHPSIRFTPLDESTIAFREKLFENRGGFRYLPVMHSTLRLDREHQSASVTGFANLSVLFVLGYLAYRAWADPTFLPVAALLVVVLIISYLAQVGLNNRILAAVGAPSAAPVEPPA